MAYLTGTNKMSGLVVDANLNMGAHDITLGAGSLTDGKDVGDLANGYAGIALKDLYPHLTVALFQVTPATAVTSFTNPERINDNDEVNPGYSTVIGHGVEIDLGGYYYVNQFKQFGDAVNNGDGSWKIQYLDRNVAWTDWVTGIVTRDTTDWGAWTAIAVPRVVSKIRWLITAVDTGSGGASAVREIDMDGEG